LIFPLAIIATPIQLAVIVGLVVLLFVPKYVPVIARIMGRMLHREVKRRYGIALRSAPAVSRPVARQQAEQEPVVEVTRSVVPEVEGTSEPARIDSPGPSRAPVWLMSTVAAGAAAVLLWFLLHGR